MPLKIILSLWQSAPLRNRTTSATRQGAARTKPSVTRLAPPGHGAAPLLGVMPLGTPKMFLGGSWRQLCHMSSCRRCWGWFNSDLSLERLRRISVSSLPDHGQSAARAFWAKPPQAARNQGNIPAPHLSQKQPKSRL